MALAIDKVAPRPYHFFRAGALPLDQEAKPVKSPWSIVLLSWKVILSVYNAGKPFGGRGSAPDPTRGAYSALHTS